jgi:hypothetical protein
MIQALGRMQPGLPLKRGLTGVTIYDDKHLGIIITLFTTLNIRDGSVAGRNMQRHQPQKLLCFVKAKRGRIALGPGRTHHGG